MALFTLNKTSGKGNDTITVTPSAWNGRSSKSVKIIGKSKDNPAIKAELTATMAGAGLKVVQQTVKVNGVSKTVNAATGMAENAIFTKDTNQIILSGKSNAQQFSISGTPVASSSLTVKIDSLGGTAYKYLKQDGSLSNTPVTITWSGVAGMSVAIAGDPGATGYYSFEISGITVKANDMAEDRYVEIVAMGVSDANVVGVSGTQAGADPSISFNKSTLSFTPGSLVDQTFSVTSNDDWAIEIQEI